MKKLLVQFSDLRRNMPRHVQWLLLGAAFVVVLILMILLLRGDHKTDIAVPDDTTGAEITITPDMVDWGKTKTGTTESMRIAVSANAPVRVMAVRLTREMPGLATPKTTCTNIGEINDKISCTISLEYAPTAAAAPQQVPLQIDWRGAAQPDEMMRTNEILITLGAEKTDPVVVPEPKTPTTPAPDVPVAAVANNRTPDPEPVVNTTRDDIRQDIETIAPDMSFIAPSPSIITPAPGSDVPQLPSDVTTDTYTQTAEACSDFAFPGYNQSGQQIGWIKPESGAYYFHPFSDRDCDKPTGVYNPDNGIITAINNPSQKIGTDADNIGYTTINDGAIPQLSNPVTAKRVNRATQADTPEPAAQMARMSAMWAPTAASIVRAAPPTDVEFGSTGQNTVTSTQIYDRTFILRQYKPIPATIVSDVRADPSLYKAGNSLPVRATVDRNVYSDNGRTVIIPTGTLLLGYLTGTMPGPYTAIGRMEIKWYQFILPNGVEFNFNGSNDPFSGDAQGRVGVPGRGSTDYLEQFVMPMLTAIVPAAVNMIAPIADRFVNQIDLDNNTVVQSGTVRSSELAKNEIITAWNQVAQKLMVDMMDNTTPPFTIAAGTRITVYSPVDLQVTCGDKGSSDKKCAVAPYGNAQRQNWTHQATPDYKDGSWVGQSRSFDMQKFCTQDINGNWEVKSSAAGEISNSGYSYSTVAFFCQSLNYQAINNARQDAVFQNQQQQFLKNDYQTSTITGVSGPNSGIIGNQKYNEEILDLKYDDDGTIQNPFQTPAVEEVPVITCEDGNVPDTNGCCTGEIYTDMGEQGFNCCPETGGDCFPPIK